MMQEQKPKEKRFQWNIKFPWGRPRNDDKSISPERKEALLKMLLDLQWRGVDSPILSHHLQSLFTGVAASMTVLTVLIVGCIGYMQMSGTHIEGMWKPLGLACCVVGLSVAFWMKGEKMTWEPFKAFGSLSKEEKKYLGQCLDQAAAAHSVQEMKEKTRMLIQIGVDVSGFIKDVQKKGFISDAHVEKIKTLYKKEVDKLNREKNSVGLEGFLSLGGLGERAGDKVLVGDDLLRLKAEGMISQKELEREKQKVMKKLVHPSS